MEQLLVIIQQIYQLLNILNCYTQGEREELLEGYPRFLSQVKELLGILDRIVGGSTYWGWKCRAIRQSMVVCLTRNTWVFILRRYNGTYTQARGH